MNTCIKCGKPIADGELFCDACSLNPYDFTDTPERAPEVNVPGQLRAPVRQAKKPAAAPAPVKPVRRRVGAGTIFLIVVTVLSLAAAAYGLLTLSSRRVALRLREEEMTRQEAEVSALRAEKDELTAQVSQLESDLSAKNDLIETLRENIDTAESAASQTQYDMTAQKAELEKLEQALEDKQAELTAQEEKYDALVTQSAAAQAAADFMQSYVVLVENDGTGLYHRYGCSRFAGKTFWAYSRKLAENSGYSPCPACVK